MYTYVWVFILRRGKYEETSKIQHLLPVLQKAH